MSEPFTSPTLYFRIAPLRRRQWRKACEAAKAAAELEAVYREIEAAHRCRRCRVQAGEQCRTKGGFPRRVPHTERIADFDHQP